MTEALSRAKRVPWATRVRQAGRRPAALRKPGLSRWCWGGNGWWVLVGDRPAEGRQVCSRTGSRGPQTGPQRRPTRTAQRTRMPFQERIEYCDKQIVMAAMGGLLTMLAESSTGTLAGNAHATLWWPRRGAMRPALPRYTSATWIAERPHPVVLSQAPRPADHGRHRRWRFEMGADPTAP